MTTCPRRMTLTDVRQHIGLKVNAAPMTQRQYYSNVVKRLKQEAASEAREQRGQLDSE